MRNLILVVVIVIISATVFLVASNNSWSPSDSVKSVAVGNLAPDFQLEDTKGNKVSLSDFRGKIVMVNFWATWCPPCIEEMPSMERLNKTLAGDEFVMLAINTEQNGRSIVPAFLDKTAYTFPILYDDKGVVQKRYGVFKFPESFIIHKDGTVAEKIIGPLDWSSVKTITYFKNLIKE
jgi:peroxiredoxin